MDFDGSRVIDIIRPKALDNVDVSATTRQDPRDSAHASPDTTEGIRPM